MSDREGFLVVNFRIIFLLINLNSGIILYIAPTKNESKSQFVLFCTEKFGSAEEMLLPNLIEGMEEKQESHENLAHTKTESLKNNINGLTKKFDITKLLDEVARSQGEQFKKLTAKITHLENKLNDRIKEEKNASQTSLDEESIKNFLQVLRDKGLFDNFTNKDTVFEPYLVKIDD